VCNKTPHRQGSEARVWLDLGRYSCDASVHPAGAVQEQDSVEQSAHGACMPLREILPARRTFLLFSGLLGRGEAAGGLHVALGRQMHGVRWHEAAVCILHRNLTGASHFSAVFWPVGAWGGCWAEVLAQ